MTSTTLPSPPPPAHRRRPGAWSLLLAAAMVVALPAEAQELPPDAEGAAQRLADSPRHGEWITYDAGQGDEVLAWVVYPERSDPAPVVVVIHEIYGMSDWIRSVADQLAADGFIAIAPDLLWGHGPDGEGSEALGEDVRATIRTLERADVNRRLRAAGEYARSLPAAGESVGVVGYCWGGSSSFLLATDWPELDAAVVYYGSSPESGYEAIEAPVLGLYGGDDNRVNSTIPRAEEAMGALGKPYTPVIFDGAGHGFLRQQQGRDGANMAATRQAWPRTVAFFREHLGN